MARKKVVFIIVEGPSDQDALETLLTKIFDSKAVIVKVMHGDITTNLDVTPENIKKKLAEAIKSYASQFGLKSSHCHFSILMLTSFVLTSNNNTCWNMS